MATGVTPAAAAPAVRVAGLPTDRMNFYAAGQARPNWCWAACVQMVLSSRGAGGGLTQEQFVRLTYGDAADLPGDPVQVVHQLDDWPVRAADGRDARLHATVGIGPPAVEVLLDSLGRGLPVIVVYGANEQVVGHAVVVTAVVYEDSTSGPRPRSVHARDPDPAFAATQGKRTLTPEELARVSWYCLLSEVAVTPMHAHGRGTPRQVNKSDVAGDRAERGRRPLAGASKFTPVTLCLLSRLRLFICGREFHEEAVRVQGEDHRPGHRQFPARLRVVALHFRP